MKVNGILTSILVILAFFVSTAAADEPCIVCDLMVGQPQANIMLSINDEAHEITAKLYYENYTEEPPRINIDNALMFVYVDPAEGEEELLRIYSDDEGAGVFDFGTYAERAQEEQITYNFRIIYCPFCHPGDEGYPCGFEECMEYAGIETDYADTEEVPLGEGVVEPAEEDRNLGHYLPTSISLNYVPPPAPEALTPAFCLPLIIVFALLGGALYYTGRNPFGAFTLGSPRVGRHIRYTPTGRGFSLNIRYVAQSIKGAAGEAKQIKAKKAKRASMSAADLKKEKEQKKEKGKQYALQAVTLGGYGMIMGGAGTVTRDGKTVTMGDGRGIKQILEGAPGSVKKAKGQFKASLYTTMPSKRGAIGKKGGAKGFFAGYGQQVFEGVIKAGGGLLKSSVLSGIFGTALADKMVGFAVDKDAAAVAQGYAERDIEKEDQQKLFNKLDTMVKEEKATEVVVDGITYYEMEQVQEKPDGTLSVATVRVEKEAFKEGRLEGTQTISKADRVEIRSFSGEYNKQTGTFDTKLETVTIKKGSGEEMIVATYSVAEPAKFPGEYTLQLESMQLGQSEQHLENLKADPAKYEQVSTAALEFAKSFDGKGISAEQVATTFMGTNIDKGTTLGSLAVELGRAQYNVDAACDRIQEATVNAGLHAWYKTDKEFKAATKDASAGINYQMSQADISKQAAVLLLHAPPEPGQSSVEIFNHYKGQANAAVSEAGQNKAKQEYTQPTPGQQAGAQAIYGMGTELASATMTKEKALHEAQHKIAQMDLTSEQKKEAYQVAQDLYSDAKNTAKTWQTATKEASTTYQKVENTAAENLKPVYAGESKEAREAVVHAATTAGITTYYQVESYEGMASSDKKKQMQDEVAKGVITGSKGAIVETPEQAYLSDLITNGTYKTPEPPKPPKLPKFKPDVTEAEKQMAQQEALIKFLQDSQKYEEESQQWKDKKDDLVYGTGLNTSVGSALVLTSAIKKGVELPKEVYKDAMEGMENADPAKWKDAGTRAMEEVEKQQAEKRKKELKGMQGAKEIGL